MPEPKELRELDDAYAGIKDIIPRRNKAARHALEDFHDEFGKTLHKLQKYGFGPELLEIRLLRLDALFDRLAPHSLVMPAKLTAALVAGVVGATIAYVAFPESLRQDVATLPGGIYLTIVGGALAAFSVLIGMLVLKATKTGSYVGATGLFVLLPSLLNVAFLFGWAYWVPSGSAGNCLSSPADKVDAFYFSLTTMTTTGFGDLTPVTTVCRAFATLQMGTTFVIVTSLFALYISRASSSTR